MATSQTYSETRYHRNVGRAFLGAGLAMFAFLAAMFWLNADRLSGPRRAEWYDLMFVRFPENTATLVAGAVTVVGIVVLLRARRTARILAGGTPAFATVMTIADTGTRVNFQPQLRLRLSVRAAGGQPYEVTVKKVVPVLLLPRLRSGLPLPVRVDRSRPTRVVIDWAAALAPVPGPGAGASTAATAAATPGGSAAGPTPWPAPAPAPGPVPAQGFYAPLDAVGIRSSTPHLPGLPSIPRPATSREDLKELVRSVGVPGMATLTAVVPMEPVDDRRLFRMDLRVRLDSGASYLERGEPVPVDPEHATKAVAGTDVPVRVALVDGVAVTLFEWERI